MNATVSTPEWLLTVAGGVAVISIMVWCACCAAAGLIAHDPDHLRQFGEEGTRPCDQSADADKGAEETLR